MKQAYPNTITLEHTDATFIETLERKGNVNVWHYEWVDRPESFSMLTPSNKVQSKRRLTEWELTQYVLQMEGEYERLLPEIEEYPKQGIAHKANKNYLCIINHKNLNNEKRSH